MVIKICLTFKKKKTEPSSWMPKLQRSTEHKDIKEAGMKQEENHSSSKVNITHSEPPLYRRHLITKWDFEVGGG